MGDNNGSSNGGASPPPPSSSQPSPPAPFNPEQYKAMQRQSWDGVAQGWLAWWQTFEKGAQKVSDRLVELAEVKPGHRVLDVATGIGEPAITAAKRVRPSGRVTAIDISPQMLEIARQRAITNGLEQVVEFKEGDAEAVGLHDSRFDAVLSRWGLMFFPNLDATLDKMHRALVPGGILSAAVWSAPPRVPLLDLAFSTARKQINATPPPPGALGPFRLADEVALRRSLARAGFGNVRTEKMTVTFSFSSAEDFMRFHRSIAAPIHTMIAGQTDERKEELWKSIADAARPYAGPGGRIDLDNEVICATGRRQRRWS